MNAWDYLFTAGLLVLLAAWAWVKAPAEHDCCDCEGCAPEVPPIQGAHGAYEEPDHVRQKREAYAARRLLTAHDIEVAEHRRAMAGREP